MSESIFDNESISIGISEKKQNVEFADDLEKGNKPDPQNSDAKIIAPENLFTCAICYGEYDASDK